MSLKIPTSSPLSSARSTPATFQTASQEAGTTYKAVRALPRELQQQVNIYLDEYLISQAIRVLLSLISATSSNDQSCVQIPSPDYISILNTLSIHPDSTSRASSSDRLSQANLARKYLQALLQICGPVNASFAKAYRIRTFDHDRINANDDDDESAASDLLNMKYADVHNVFGRKSDFWAILGWAFNCSTLPGPYAVRWSYWSLWLHHMMDVLEKDWQDREAQDDCQNSLIWHYIVSSSGNRPRRAVNAIFANGSQECLKLYTEVFAKELKTPKGQKGTTLKERSKVEIEKEEYGDWLEASESSTDDEVHVKTEDVMGRPAKRMRTRTPSTKRRKAPRADRIMGEDSQASGAEDGEAPHGLGPPDSIALRLRMIQLLSNVSAHRQLSRSDEWPDIRELYTFFVEEIKTLPLPAFRHMILPGPAKGLTADARITLCDFLLSRILASDKLRTFTTTLEPMTQDRLVAEYLSFPAERGRKGIEQQAKMSLLLESMVRVLAAQPGMLQANAPLTNAVTSGIRAREDRASQIVDGIASRKGTLSSDEQAALQTLRESSVRLSFVVKRLAVS